jgi:hypothetical protein
MPHVGLPQPHPRRASRNGYEWRLGKGGKPCRWHPTRVERGGTLRRRRFDGAGGPSLSSGMNHSDSAISTGAKSIKYIRPSCRGWGQQAAAAIANAASLD